MQEIFQLFFKYLTQHKRVILSRNPIPQTLIKQGFLNIEKQDF